MGLSLGHTQPVSTHSQSQGLRSVSHYAALLVDPDNTCVSAEAPMRLAVYQRIAAVLPAGHAVKWGDCVIAGE